MPEKKPYEVVLWSGPITTGARIALTDDERDVLVILAGRLYSAREYATRQRQPYMTVDAIEE